jgi:hypothetical protein
VKKNEDSRTDDEYYDCDADDVGCGDNGGSNGGGGG